MNIIKAEIIGAGYMWVMLMTLLVLAVLVMKYFHVLCYKRETDEDAETYKEFASEHSKDDKEFIERLEIENEMLSDHKKRMIICLIAFPLAALVLSFTVVIMREDTAIRTLMIMASLGASLCFSAILGIHLYYKWLIERNIRILFDNCKK